MCWLAENSNHTSMLTPCELVTFVMFNNVVCLVNVILQVYTSAAYMSYLLYVLCVCVCMCVCVVCVCM